MAFAARNNLAVALIITLLLTAASRLPFLNAGYGANIDAWRVARAARQIAETGRYEASRLPGYPLHEITSAAISRGGAVALNGASAVMSLVAVAAFALIARKAGVRDVMLLALAFAMTPVVYVNSVTSKDYMWAIALSLLSLLAALHRRAVLAGFCLGLAIGCRITSAAILVPIAIILASDTASVMRRRSVAVCTAVAFATGAAAFTPVFSRYGRGFFTFYDEHARPDAETILQKATVDVWGMLGITAVLVLLCAFLWRVCRGRGNDGEAYLSLQAALVVTVVLYTVAYLRLPDQAGYLIPIVPAVLLLGAINVPRRALQIACGLLLLAPFVDITNARLRSGAIFVDRAERLSAMRRVESLVAFCRTLPGRNVIVAGASEPQIELIFPETKSEPTQYAYLLSREQLIAAQRDGVTVYYLPAMRAFNASVHHIDLEQFGAHNLLEVYDARARPH
jgi:hypothetical protein